MIRQTMSSMQGDTGKNDSWDNQKPQSTAPRMIKMNLNDGPTGTVATLWISDLTLGSSTPKLAFNTLIVDTRLVQSQGVTTLVVTVPSHRETRCSTTLVPIYLCLLEDDIVVGTWHLADFSYEGIMQPEYTDQAKSISLTNPPLMASPPTPPQTTETTETSTSRSAVPAAAQRMISSPYHDDMYRSIALESSLASLSTSLPGNDFSNLSVQSALTSGDERYQPTFRQRASSIADLTYNDDDPNFSANSTSGFTNLFTENLDPNTTPTTTLSYSPRANVIQQAKPIFCIPTTTTATTNFTSNYISVPTSTNHRQRLHLPRSHSSGTLKASGHRSSTSVASYQPYPGLISHSNLVLSGDLNSMTEHWYPEEWHCFRRLVRFHRDKLDHDIHCSFQSITPNGMMQAERQSSHTGITTTCLNGSAAETALHQQQQQKCSMAAPATTTTTSIMVSCIYWPDKKDWFITSVDCIHLLEHLLDLQFSVEEKNRVRRNLEGFRPLTVSKSKSDSADFFKLIMSFPHPKPRNIEKDLKVFPWKSLPYALKKIVTKYTSSSYDQGIISNNDNDGSSTGRQRKYRKRRTSYQNVSPTSSPTTLPSSSIVPVSSQLPQLPTLSSSSSSSSASLPSTSSASSSSSAMYHRRASAPSRDFNNSSRDCRPFFPVSSVMPMTYQPLPISSSRPLPNSDAIASYRFDSTVRLPPLDTPYDMHDLINSTQLIPSSPPSPSTSSSTSPIRKSDMQHPLFP